MLFLFGLMLATLWLRVRSPAPVAPPVPSMAAEMNFLNRSSRVFPQSQDSVLPAFTSPQEDRDKPASVTGIKEGSWRSEMRELRNLAKLDPAAALALALRQSSLEEREGALREVCVEVSRWDPEGALLTAWHWQLGQSGDGAAENAALENLAGKWAAVDFISAFAWASGQPSNENDSRRDRVMKGFALSLSKTSPADAAWIVAEQIPPGPVQIEAALAVLGQWAARDPEGAKAWASRFPEGGLRDSAFENLARVSSGNPTR